MSGSNSDSHEQWNKLQKWLKEEHPGYESNLPLRDVPGLERGLVARASKSGDTLLHIPASAMLNPLTLIHDTAIPIHLFPQSSSRPRRTPTAASSSSSTSHHVNSNGEGDDGSSAKRRKPNSKLDTTQLLTLHLALTRDPKGRYKSPWETYIDTLPAEFRPWHPLTWLIPPRPKSTSSQSTPSSSSSPSSSATPQSASKTKNSNKVDLAATTSASHHKDRNDEVGHAEADADWRWWNDLAATGLSPSTKRKVEDVKKRFDEDYAVLSDVLKDEEPFRSHRLADVLDQEDFIWAWLNVNTRSISIPLGLGEPSERMNHTLVPIMDFINHSSDPKIITPRVQQLPTASRARRISQPNYITNGTTNASIPSTGNTRMVSPITPTSATATTTQTNTNSANAHSLRKADKHLIPGKIDFRLVCPERGLDEDEEVFFEYGGHPSSTLFAEYGFCEVPKAPSGRGQNQGQGQDRTEAEAETSPPNPNEPTSQSAAQAGDGEGKIVDGGSTAEESGWLGMRYGEVDVTWLVDELWGSLDVDEAAEKREVLEAIGCWGGNTLHAQPSPAHPSHSLLMTLRVLHTPTSSPKLPSIARGLVSYVSPSVEDRTIESLQGICKRVIKDAKKRAKGIDKLKVKIKTKLKVKDDLAPSPSPSSLPSTDGVNGTGNMNFTKRVEAEAEEMEMTKRGVLEMLCAMGEEEVVIATRVLERIQNGEEL
ncbi:hypothetical protein IAU59_006207 [Kwoniella sp. CBS 9459]